MTPNEINIAIAEACGWKAVVSPTNDNHWWAENANGLVYDGGVSEDHCKRVCYPNYLHDLNAMHEAEKLIKDTRRGQYNAEISLIAAKRNLSSAVREPQFIFDCIHATASQRAEAFLRTIGKWKE